MQKTQTSWGKRASLESIQPNLCSRQRQLQQVAQSSVQLGFQFLRGWRLHKLTSQSVPEFDQPHHKKSFPPLYFIFVPRAHTCLWQMCALPCVGEWCSTGGHKEVPAGATKMCPVGKRAPASSRQWCLPVPPCLWGSRSFQCPKGKAAQSGNTAWQFC